MAGIYDERIIGAKQQADTARKLREGITAPEGQMVSGWYVPPSITQYMANALKSYGAGKDEQTAQSEYERMQKQKQTETADILRQLEPQASVQVSPEMANAAYGQGDINSVMANPMPQTQTTYQPVDERTRMAALLRGAAVNPEAFQPQMQMAQWDIGRQDKKEALQQAEALRREQMTAQQEQWQRDENLRRDLANQASVDRRFISQQSQIGQNKPPAGYRYTPTGNLEMIPGGPADQKAQMREAGGATVDDVAASLRDQYNQLDASGGITNPNKSTLENVGAGVSSSAVGQAAGRLFGTNNQSLRNTIAQQRPLLLQAIMKATGMSAKQMDSNAEMKLYLSTATDPTLDISANRRALDMIEKLYGSGAGNKPITGGNNPPAGGAQPQGGVRRFNPATGQLE